MSQTEDYSPEDSLPDHSEKLLQRSMVFNSSTYCQNKTFNTSGICFFKFSKQIDRHAYTMPRQLALAPGNEVLLMECQPGVPGREAARALLLVQTPFSFLIKADVPCVFDRPQTSYFSSVQSLSHVRLFANPCAPGQTSLSNTNSQSLLKLMSIES